MGVLGVWTLMASIRIYIVLGSIVFAFAWRLLEKKGGNNHEKRA
jgi:hypothetical protein